MKRAATVFLLMALCGGCASVQTLNGLVDYSREQEAMKRYVENQAEKIERLFADIEKNKLIVGKTTKREVIRSYGEPILAEEQKENRRLLYRKALESFPEKKAYLFFNSDDILIGIEVKANNS